MRLPLPLPLTQPDPAHALGVLPPTRSPLLAHPLALCPPPLPHHLAPQLEASRRALKADGAAKKSSEAAALATLRRAEEAKVAAIMERNAKGRELAEQRRQAREKKYEQQKEAALSARKRRDVAYAELRASNHAEEKAKKVMRGPFFLPCGSLAR